MLNLKSDNCLAQADTVLKIASRYHAVSVILLSLYCHLIYSKTTVKLQYIRVLLLSKILCQYGGVNLTTNLH